MAVCRFDRRVQDSPVRPPLTAQQVITRLRGILKTCPEFYPAELELACRLLLALRSEFDGIARPEGNVRSLHGLDAIYSEALDVVLFPLPADERQVARLGFAERIG